MAQLERTVLFLLGIVLAAHGTFAAGIEIDHAGLPAIEPTVFVLRQQVDLGKPLKTSDYKSKSGIPVLPKASIEQVQALVNQPSRGIIGIDYAGRAGTVLFNDAQQPHAVLAPVSAGQAGKIIPITQEMVKDVRGLIRSGDVKGAYTILTGLFEGAKQDQNPIESGGFGTMGAPSARNEAVTPQMKAKLMAVYQKLRSTDFAGLTWSRAIPKGIIFFQVALEGAKFAGNYQFDALVPAGVVAPNGARDPNQASYFILARSGGMKGGTMYSNPISLSAAPGTSSIANQGIMPLLANEKDGGFDYRQNGNIITVDAGIVKDVRDTIKETIVSNMDLIQALKPGWQLSIQTPMMNPRVPRSPRNPYIYLKGPNFGRMFFLSEAREILRVYFEYRWWNPLTWCSRYPTKLDVALQTRAVLQIMKLASQRS